MTLPSKVVFLFEVDSTLLDNDRVLIDLRCHNERIIQELANEMGRPKV